MCLSDSKDIEAGRNVDSGSEQIAIHGGGWETSKHAPTRRHPVRPRLRVMRERAGN